MYVKCPHCGTSFALDPAVVKDFGGWARCGACMQPFNSETAALDELPVDDPADVLVRKFDYADDAGDFKEQLGEANKRNSFIVEPHSRSEIPGFLRVGEADSISELAAEDQAQIPLPLNTAQLEQQSDSSQSIQTEPDQLGTGFESPLGEPVQDKASDVEASLSVLVSKSEDTQPPSSSISAEKVESLDQQEVLDDPDWREQLEADISAAEKATESEYGDALQSVLIGANTVIAESRDDPLNVQTSLASVAEERSSADSFDSLSNEIEVDEELQASSSVEPVVAAWPEVMEGRGIEPINDSSDDGEGSASNQVEEQKDHGFGNISSSSGAYDKVMSDKAVLQNPRLWLASIIIFSVLALVQLISLNKLELSQTVFGRPLVNLWCGISGCPAGELVQVGEIELVHTSVSAHDTEAGVLVVDVHMVSRTPLGQPHPAIQLTLTDRDGLPAARRVFTAEEYLANTAKNELAPNVIIELTLEIADPPDDSVGFEVALVDQR